MASLEFLSASAASARQAGEWRYQYARQGKTLSTADCLIGAIALQHQAILVTGNSKDFPMAELTLPPLPWKGIFWKQP